MFRWNLSSNSGYDWLRVWISVKILVKDAGGVEVVYWSYLDSKGYQWDLGPKQKLKSYAISTLVGLFKALFFFVSNYIVSSNYSYLIIIKTFWQHEFPWISLTIHIYWSLLLVNLLMGTQCLHWADGEFFAIQSTQVYSCLRVHRKIYLMSSSLLLQQCPACFANLTWMVCEMRGTLLFCRMLLPGFAQNSVQHSSTQ